MMKYIDFGNKKVSSITLGTVQLGMNYGIANNDGKPSLEKSLSMLRTSAKHGITSLDTASAYGNSEEILGTYLHELENDKLPYITSKLKLTLPADSSESEVKRAVYESVEGSLSRLGIKKLDTLLLHNASDMTTYGDKVARALASLIRDGYVERVGVSVYFADEIDEMLKNDIYTDIQLPMSIFDLALERRGYIEKLNKRGVSIFVRSVFLQGLFFLNPDTVTNEALREYAVPHIRKLHEFCEKSGMSIPQLAATYIRDIPGITTLVLGADSEEQIEKNVDALSAPALSESLRSEIQEAFSAVNMEKIMEVLRIPKK